MTQIGFGSFSANEGASVIVMSPARRKRMGGQVICLQEPPGPRPPALNRSHAAAGPFNLQKRVEALLGLLQGEGNPSQLAAAAGLAVHQDRTALPNAMTSLW